MGKKSASKKRVGGEEGGSQERRTKARHERGSSSLAPVTPNLTLLFRNIDALSVFRAKFHDRHILEGKIVRFDELENMYAYQNVDTASYIANHGWVDFVKVKKPIYPTLLRILMSNLDVNTMISWIGKKKVDLSLEAWCRVFNIPNTTVEEEAFIWNMSKEDLFFRLSGIQGLGINPFIKMNQLHQEANVRLTAQIVMNVLVPKRGSKEQIKSEEGRLLYAMIYGSEINLAKIIVDRLKSAVIRKSSPICYGMHLIEMMERAGVSLDCAGDNPKICRAEISHHTLKRLGYKKDFGGWNFVGRGKVNVSFSEGGREQRRDEPEEGRTEGEEGEPTQEQTMPTQAESSIPSPSRSRPQNPTLQLSSQIANLATKNELAHLRHFMAEQFQLLQATLLSKLDAMDARLQNCEEKLQIQASHPPPSAPTQPTHPHDPKGKAPLTSPTPSHHSSSHHTPHSTASPIPPQPSQPALQPTPPQSSLPTATPHPPSPQPQPRSPSTPQSHASSSPHFEVVARTPQVQSPSSDSEATQSASPPSPTIPMPTLASPPIKFASASYQRRKKPATPPDV